MFACLCSILQQSCVDLSKHSEWPYSVPKTAKLAGGNVRKWVGKLCEGNKFSDRFDPFLMEPPIFEIFFVTPCL